MNTYVTAEISASAVAANTAWLRGLLAARATAGPKPKLCAVVKADALGHGVELLWPTLARLADWLAVATPAEAVRLRELGYDGPLLQFLPPCAHADSREQAEALEDLIRRRVTLTLSAADELAPIAAAARKARVAADVHLKVDTGMGRSGALPSAAVELAARVRAADGLRLAGLYTHLATADEPDKSATLEQLRVFRAVAEAIPRREELIVHAANSAATIALPESHLDMVRCGVAVVGYWLASGSPLNSSPLNSSQLNHLSPDRPQLDRSPLDRPQLDRSPPDRPPLRPAMRLWAPLVQVKRLPAGAGVGYGLTRRLARPSTIGIVPIGYGDGYMRCLSDRATMRVGGRDCQVLGRVSMDQTIVDLTDAPGARAGEPAEIISPDPAAMNSLECLSRLAGTIPQEIACRLACRVRRVLVA